MSKFKVGDRVKCINNLGVYHLERNSREYIVTELIKGVCNSSTLFVKIKGLCRTYYEDRFELVEPTSPSLTQWFTPLKRLYLLGIVLI